MTEASEVQMVPIAEITVLNPRARNRKTFAELVTSIAHLGLKKPVTVSQREDGGYDLVCGQGRLEAFVELGQTEIPAFVIRAAHEDCFVMSLVENLARKQRGAMELIKEIGALKERGYSAQEIARKTDFTPEYINAICYLIERAERRLLDGVERGIIPFYIALEIAKSKDVEVQQALAEAYENRTLPGKQVLAIRRIIEDRQRLGKSTYGKGGGHAKKPVTAEALVRAYRKETERQKLLIKRATLAQSRLLFVTNALRHLLSEEHFVTLLRAEALSTMPRPLMERLDAVGRYGPG